MKEVYVVSDTELRVIGIYTDRERARAEAIKANDKYEQYIFEVETWKLNEPAIINIYDEMI